MNRKRAGNLCLPGTDCDSINWGDEADAKDLLAPGAETNPGRRRRRRGVVMADAGSAKDGIDMINKVKNEEFDDSFSDGLLDMIDLKKDAERNPLTQSVLKLNVDMIDTFLVKCLDDTVCRDQLLASRLESIKLSSSSPSGSEGNKFFKRIE